MHLFFLKEKKKFCLYSNIQEPFVHIYSSVVLLCFHCKFLAVANACLLFLLMSAWQ